MNYSTGDRISHVSGYVENSFTPNTKVSFFFIVIVSYSEMTAFSQAYKNLICKIMLK